MQSLWCGYAVVAVDAQEVFDYVAGALHVDAVGGHTQVHTAVGVFGGDFDFKRRQYGAYGIGRYFLTQQLGDAAVREFDLEGFCHSGIDVDYRTGADTSGYVLYEQCGELHGVDAAVGVYAAFVAERCVGVEAVTAGCLAHRGGIETGRLQEEVGSGFGHA